MRSYQILALVAGIIGMLIVFLVYFVLQGLASLLSAFGKAPDNAETTFIQIGISIVLYVIVIIFPFAVKSHKVSGGVLLILAFATLVSAGGFGVVSFAMLIAAGIVAIRYKPDGSKAARRGGNSGTGDTGTGDPLQILNERYVRGEITREQYNQMRSDLYGFRSRADPKQ